MGGIADLVGALALLDAMKAWDARQEERKSGQEEVFVPFKLPPLAQSADQDSRKEEPVYRFSYTGLRLVHDEKVCGAMEQAHLDAELARTSPQAVWPFLNRLLSLIRGRLNRFARVEQPERCFHLQRDCSPPAAEH